MALPAGLALLSINSAGRWRQDGGWGPRSVKAAHTVSAVKAINARKTAT
jgi:hypothetical protein